MKSLIKYIAEATDAKGTKMGIHKNFETVESLEELVKKRGENERGGVIFLKCAFVPTWDTYPECQFNGLSLKKGELHFEFTGGGYNYENRWYEWVPFTTDGVKLKYSDHNGRKQIIEYTAEDISEFLDKVADKYN